MPAVFFAVIATAFVASAMNLAPDAGAYALFAAIFGAACGYALSRDER